MCAWCEVYFKIIKNKSKSYEKGSLHFVHTSLWRIVSNNWFCVRVGKHIGWWLKDQQKKTPLSIPNLLASWKIFFLVFSSRYPGISSGHHSTFTSTCTKSIATDKSLKRSDWNEGIPFFRILIYFYDFKTFLTPMLILFQAILNSSTNHKIFIYIYIKRRERFLFKISGFSWFQLLYIFI